MTAEGLVLGEVGDKNQVRRCWTTVTDQGNDNAKAGMGQVVGSSWVESDVARVASAGEPVDTV